MTIEPGSFHARDREIRLGICLGRGGFGSVYRAEILGAQGFRKTVAVKVLHLDEERAPDIARRLRDEARVLGLLRHRAIVAVDDLVRLGGNWALVMEYVGGADLSALLADGPLPLRVAAEVGFEVASALDAAHRAVHPDTGAPLGVIHRDVKPANVRVTPAGEVKVLDFGIAHARFAGRESETVETRFGSAGYVAPERYEGRDLPASDVFSLGVVLFECLAGRKLGLLPVRPAAFAEHLLDSLDSLDAAPPPLRDLLGAMLAYEPEGRPTAQEVALRLREIAATAEGPWLAEWAPERAPAEAPSRGAPTVPDPAAGSMEGADAPPPPEPPAPAGERWAARRLIVLAAIVAGAAIAIGTFLLALPLGVLPAGTPTPPSEAPGGEAHGGAPTPQGPPAEPTPAPSEEPAPAAGAPESAEPREGSAGATAPRAGRRPPPAPSPPAPVQPAPATGTLRVVGRVQSVVLVGPDARYSHGAIPPGTYDLEFTFEPGGALLRRAGAVRVEAGETVTVRCDALAESCRQER